MLDIIIAAALSAAPAKAHHAHHRHHHHAVARHVTRKQSAATKTATQVMPRASATVPATSGTTAQFTLTATDSRVPRNIPNTVSGWTGNALDFSFSGFDGAAHRLAEFAGKPLVLNFWADWCGYCKAEMPEFERVYRAHSGQFALLSVSDGSSEDARGYVRANGYDWQFGQADGAAQMYGIQGWPETLFIDRQGNVVDAHAGALSEAEFESRLARIL